MKNSIILGQYSSVITAEELDNLLPDFGKKQIHIRDIGMYRKSGYGQYSMAVEMRVNGEAKTFKTHSTSSQTFDMDDEVEQHRIVLEAVLNNCSEQIEDWAAELNPYIQYQIVKFDGNGNRLGGIEVKEEYLSLEEAAADFVKVVDSIQDRTHSAARKEENWLAEYSPKPSEIYEVEIRKYVNHNWEDFKTEDFSEKTLEILSTKGIDPQAPTWIISDEYLIEN